MSAPGAPGALPPSSIARVGPAARLADDVAFASLREFAIDRAQQASGEVWTDYNLHDPGVTILEAVCFAMTDLVYRADFAVADHLCGPGGAIDFDRQALFAPEVIFPCRATTALDYRRVLLDAGRTPVGLSFDDVRFLPCDGASNGLHHLGLLPSQPGEAAGTTA